MDADKEKHDTLLNDLKIKQTVLNEQIGIKTCVERKRLENLVNTVKDILDGVRGNRDLHVLEIPDLENEESAAQRRNQLKQGLKILTPNQLLSRLPISLAQLKEENNSEKLKTKLGSYCILCTDQKNLQNNSVKVWPTLFKDENNFYEH